MPGQKISYKDYVDSLGGERWREDDSGRQTDMAVPEEVWNGLSFEEQFKLMGTSGGSLYGNATGAGGYMVGDDSDIAARWYANNQVPDYMRNNQGNAFFVTQEKPTQHLRGESWQDPETGLWITPHENIDPAYLQQLNDAETRSGFFTSDNPLGNILRGVGVVTGAAGLESLLSGGLEGLLGNSGLGEFGGLAPEEALGTGWGNVPGAESLSGSLDLMPNVDPLPDLEFNPLNDLQGPVQDIVPNAPGSDLLDPNYLDSIEHDLGNTGSQFDDFLNNYVNDNADMLQPRVIDETDFLDLGIDEDALRLARGNGVGWGNAYDPDVSNVFWDRFVNGAPWYETLGNRLVDRLPAVANALKPLANKPGGGGTPSLGGLGGGSLHNYAGGSMNAPSGSVHAAAVDLMRGGGGGGGLGGLGGGGGTARGTPMEQFDNPYLKAKKLQEVLSLAEYLAGGRK